MTVDLYNIHLKKCQKDKANDYMMHAYILLGMRCPCMQAQQKLGTLGCQLSKTLIFEYLNCGTECSIKVVIVDRIK